MQITKWIGTASWWVFVVARLVGEMGEPVAGTSRDFVGFLRVGGGWTAYTPLTDAVATRNVDTAAPNALMLISLIALAVTVAAGVVQAVLSRRLLVGVIAVAAPVVGGVLVLWALYHRTGAAGAVQLSSLSVFALILTAVAVRGLGTQLGAYGNRAGAAAQAGRGADSTGGGSA